jgi:hypothetical protein
MIALTLYIFLCFPSFMLWRRSHRQNGMEGIIEVRE